MVRRVRVATARFPAELGAVARARGFLVETLTGWGAAGYDFGGPLVLSELATNAALHARTPFQVRLHIDAALLVVEVADGSPRLPRPPGYDTDATTGRGLVLIRSLCTDWGARPVNGGKVVWAQVLPDDALPAEHVHVDLDTFLDPSAEAGGHEDTTGHAGRANQPGGPGAPDGGDQIEVQIVGLPLDVHRQAQQHADELVRELTLVGEGLRQEGHTTHLPVRLVEVVEQLGNGYGELTDAQDQQIADAAAAGRPTVDLVFRLPATVTGAVEALAAILDEADAYCRSGDHLLTLTTPPELVAYRRWFLGEFSRQAAGEPPRAWTEHQTVG